MRGIEVRRRKSKEGVSRSIWMLALPTVALLAILAAVFAGSLLAKDGPSAPKGQTFHAPRITSNEAVGIVKEWIGGGTQVEVVQRIVGDLICTGYFEANGTWDVRCRVSWIPAEGYFFRVVEESGEVTAETEATVEFVRLLRQWGHVPEP